MGFRSLTYWRIPFAFIFGMAILLNPGCGDDSKSGGPAPLSALEQVTSTLGALPTVSPDGNWLAYNSAAGIMRISLLTGQVDTLLSFGTEPDWSPSGNLILFRHSDQVLGRILGTVNVHTGDTAIIRLDGFSDGAKWSPDGNTIAAAGEGLNGLVLISYPGGEVSNLSCFSPGTGVPDVCDGEMPTWAPDGQWIAFLGGPGIMKTRGVGDTAQTVIMASDVLHPAWSPNGQWIAFVMEDTNGVDYHLWVADARGEDSGLWQVTFSDGTCTASSCWDMWPRWSPDSRTIYFMSNRGKLQSDAMDIWRIGFQPR